MAEYETREQLTHAQLLDQVRFDAAGLAAAIVQDSVSDAVLMIAWMNRTSLEQTLACGEAVFWSRSRQEIWHKGATSGNVQRVVEIRLDCDGDALLLRVEPAGPACHTGATSCFYRTVTDTNTDTDTDTVTVTVNT